MEIKMAEAGSIRDRMVDLARSMLEQTRAGNITWSQTDQENEFLFSGSKSSVTVAELGPEHGNPLDVGYRISLLNTRGTPVQDLILRPTLSPATNSASIPKELEVVGDLFRVARENAL